MNHPNASTHENKKHERVELAVVFDADFFLPSQVMLTSAKMSKAADSRYRIHVFVTSAISDWVREKMMQLSAEDFEVNLYSTELTEYEKKWDGRRCVSRISGATMVRLRLPELLPDIGRLLYLDGDILVRKDLCELWETELGDALMGAVPEIAGVLSYHTHEKLGTTHYVNAGVLLMNLEKLRQASPFTPEALEAAMHHPNVVWMDQDIINLRCDQAMHLLPLRYNAMVSLCREVHHYSLRTVNDFYGSHYARWEELEEDAVILHMAGHKKPWLYTNVLHSECWMEVYRQSPCSHLSLLRTIDTEELKLEAPVPPPQENPPQENPPPPTSVNIRIRLLNLLPLLTIRRREDKSHYLLLGFLPLMKIRHTRGRSRYLLFHCIPLFDIKTKKA